MPEGDTAACAAETLVTTIVFAGERHTETFAAQH